MACAVADAPVSHRLLVAGIAGSLLPDLDTLAFRFGIPYADALGHRGFSHSLLFALAVALLGLLAAGWLRTTRQRAFVFLFLATASHGILDAFTNGGLGVAFFWPLSETRHFAPFRPIEVSPFGLERFLARAPTLLASEIRWVWLPLFGAALLVLLTRIGIRRFGR
jgi:inner membrane protein